MKNYLVIFSAILISFSLTSCSLFRSDTTPRTGPHSVPKIEGDTHEEKVYMQEQILKQQQMEVEQQRKELEHLKRQQYYNDRLRERYGN